MTAEALSQEQASPRAKNATISGLKYFITIISFVTWIDISKTVSYIERGVELNQPRLLHRAIRQNAVVRRFVTAPVLRAAINKYLPANSSRDTLLMAINAIPQSMDEPEVEIRHAAFSDIPSAVPEVEVFLFTLVVTTLLRHQQYADAAQYSTILIGFIQTLNRRTLDVFASKAYFYFSLSHEHMSNLASIRPTLLTLYRTCCLHHDEMGQAVLINLLLRNYLHYNLIDQAHSFVSKITFPETVSNNQFCRYLYYLGRIQAIQLDYSEAYLRLTMAMRKVPQDTAAGFSIATQKLGILVQLLMGDIPERAQFNNEYRQALVPYFHLTQAVRTGDLVQFNATIDKYAAVFKADKNYTLVQRLGHNVVKAGLRKISLSYSRISLEDVAAKLHLRNVAAAEYICARAIK